MGGVQDSVGSDMAAQSDSIEVLLLGTVAVTSAVSSEPLRGRRQRITLARLALAEGRPAPVSALIDDLWPEKRPKDAAHALQAHMHRLRQTLQLDIEFINDGYRLADDRISVDARRFTQSSERGRALLAAGEAELAATELEGALGLWRGPALSDIDDVLGLRPFALRLDEMRRQADADRVEALLGCARGHEVIGELRAAVAIDPLRERSWHQLIRALWSEGQESAALTAYGQAREAFVEALGAEPGSKLRELHQMMLEGRPAEDRAPVPSADRHRHGTTSQTAGIIGRARELALLDQAWSRSRAGIQVVTITGEPGIGKSHLGEHFLRAAAGADAVVLQGRCAPWTATAYQPFADVVHHFLTEFPDLVDESELQKRAPQLATILPELGDAQTAVSDAIGVDAHATMDAVAAWLAEVSRRHPVALFIEDVQWADEQTLLTLRRLLHSPRNVKALIVVTMRDQHDEVDESSPLAELLRQSDRVTHVHLARFTDSDVARLVSAERVRLATSASVPQWFDEYVRAASGGNPLFVVELTRHLLMTEAVGAHDIRSLPPGVSSVVWSRVDAMPADAKSVLQHAAVIGHRFELGYAASVSGMSEAEAETVLRPALQHHLIEPDGDSLRQFRFSHDIVRMALYDSLPALLRARLHERVAVLIEAEAMLDDLQRHQLLAHHLLRADTAGAEHRAAQHLLMAGQESYARGALADAEGLLEQVLPLLSRESDAALRCDALTTLGMAQLRLARPRYRDTLLEASRTAVDLDDAPRLTRAVLANTRGWWSGTASLDQERIVHLETALARCPDADQSVRAQLLAAWAIENVREPSMRGEVLAASQQSLALAEQSGDDHCIPAVLTQRYATMHALFEDPAECVRINRRLLTLASRSGSARMRLSAALGLAQSSMRFGEFAIADRYMSEAARLSASLDDPARLWLVQGWQAMRTLVLGKTALAEQLMLDCYSLGVKTGQADAFTWFAGQLFTLRMVQGRLSEIVDQVREQVATVAHGIPSWRAALALTFARTGHLAEAESILDEFAADSFSQVPRDMLWLHGVHYLTLTSEELGRHDLAPALYRLLLPYSGMVASNGTITAGPVDLHLGVLARLQRQHSLAEQHLRAAATMCRRINAPVWLEMINDRLALLAKAK